MVILDFLFYFLTYWFEENPQLLTWSTPMKRASYAMGLATMGYVFGFGQLIQYTIFKNQKQAFHFPDLLFIVLGLGSMQLYDYIYITRNRYERISSSNSSWLSTIGKKKGVYISFVIIVFSAIVPFLMLVMFVPFGGKKIR